MPGEHARRFSDPFIAGLAALAIALPGAVRAQGVPGSPGRGTEPPAIVGRIADVAGSVSFKPAASSEWERAERNWPVVPGDALYAAGDGNARLEVGASTVSLRPGAVIDVVTLEENSVSLRANGGVALVATGAAAEPFALLTPRGAASLGPSGLYRITAGDETVPTEIAVCRGRAILGSGRTRLGDGDAAVLSGSATEPEIRLTPSGNCDGQPVQDARLPPKVSRKMVGIRDLGERGRWASTRDGADVWYPDDVSDDWVPYRKGRWTWVAPWGWTWMDERPWGFAPFHYGRWAEVEGRWGWLPGEAGEAPVYAPALVAFIQPPAEATIVAEPAFGWVPLAPGEIYRPPYPTGGMAYVQRINGGVAAGAAIATLLAAPLAVAALRNRRVVTVIPAAAFASGRPVAASVLETRPQVLASVPVRPMGEAGLPRPTIGSRPVGRAAVPPRSVAATPAPVQGAPPAAAAPPLPSVARGGNPPVPSTIPGKPNARAAGRPPAAPKAAAPPRPAGPVTPSTRVTRPAASPPRPATLAPSGQPPRPVAAPPAAGRTTPPRVPTILSPPPRGAPVPGFQTVRPPAAAPRAQPPRPAGPGAQPPRNP